MKKNVSLKKKYPEAYNVAQRGKSSKEGSPAAERNIRAFTTGKKIRTPSGTAEFENFVIQKPKVKFTPRKKSK